MINKMNVIFLDIDGVMNSTYGQKNKKEKFHDMEINKLNLLSKFINENKIKGVVITSMRRISNEEYLYIKEELENYKISVLGKTIFNFNINSRAEEIKYYLMKHKEIENFFILDDGDDYLSYQFKDKFIKVNPYYGLTVNTLNKIHF